MLISALKMSWGAILLCSFSPYISAATVIITALLIRSIYCEVVSPEVSVSVYNYPGRTAVNVFGRTFNSLYSTADSSLVCRQLRRYWIYQHTSLPKFTTSHLLSGMGVSVFVVDKDLSNYRMSGPPIPVDYLVVSADVRVPIRKLSALFSYKRLIVDSSCSLSTAYWWKKQCPDAYLVRQSGDFIEHL